MAESSIERFTPEQVAAATESAVIDVRASHERQSELGFVPGSRSFPDTDSTAAEWIVQTYGADSFPLIVVCLSGRRSWRVAEELVQRGCRDVAHLEGGLLAWQAAGLPLCGVNPVSETEIVPVETPAAFTRAVLSCFVAESVEVQLDSGSDQIVDPRRLVEDIFDGLGEAPAVDDLLARLDCLAEQARFAGHALDHIAQNVDRLRQSLLCAAS